MDADGFPWCLRLNLPTGSASLIQRHDPPAGNSEQCSATCDSELRCSNWSGKRNSEGFYVGRICCLQNWRTVELLFCLYKNNSSSLYTIPYRTVYIVWQTLEMLSLSELFWQGNWQIVSNQHHCIIRQFLEEAFPREIISQLFFNGAHIVHIIDQLMFSYAKKSLTIRFTLKSYALWNTLF